MNSTRVIRVQGPQELADLASLAAEALKDGQLVGFATETVYGIAAVATDEQAMARLRELKSRPRRPFTVHLGRARDVERYVGQIPASAQTLISRGFPGPVTVLLATGGKLADPALNKAGLYDVLCADGYIGLRCPAEPLALAVLSAVDDPVVAPSANPAGAPSPRTAEEVLAKLDGKIDLLLDNGPTRYGNDSTVIRFDGDDWKIVRRGVFDKRMVSKLMRRSVLFVCTGNTCRSPMAAALTKKMLAERLGVSVRQLPSQGREVISAGVFAADGQPAAPEAIDAVGKLGARLGGHRSQKLAAELIRDADMVFCMTQMHVDEALRLVPSAAGKVRRLGDSDIPDPIGRGRKVYEQTADRIRGALGRVFEETIR